MAIFQESIMMEKQKITMNDIEIRRACWADQEGVLKLLVQWSTRYLDNWKKIFLPQPWMPADAFPGFVVVHQKKIVGFLGAFFSEHETEKGMLKICNISTWYVEPDYRHHGMKLLLECLKISNVSWTNLTPGPHLLELFKRAGFSSFVDKQSIVLPLPVVLRRECGQEIQITVLAANSDFPPDLESIHRMHQHLQCKQVLIRKGDDHCYCLIVVARYKKMPLAKIYYISNPRLFNQVIENIRLKLCWELKVLYLQIDGHILQDKKMRGIFTIDLYPPRIFKSNTFEKEDMTVLGSELFVLGI